MTLRSFIESAGSPDHAIAIVGDGSADPLTGMLAETFDESAIAVEPGSESDLLDPETIDDTDADVAVLLEDGSPVAASPMPELYESILAINSDLFVTGARGLEEVELPDLLANLDETRLRLRGYPLAHKEKLLLIVISRYVERQAWAAAGGTLRSSFQTLARLNDEVGTRKVYERLEDAPVEVHVYGVADGRRPDLDVAVHTGEDPEYRKGWFVVHRPADPTAPDATPAALVCYEAEPRIWDGFWTFDRERVAAIDDYVATEL
ncbi:hypothetical protein SAMN05444422_11052 [Halobiforma haloterrestris]|uniref:Diguanylate Cyclase and Two-component system sensory domain-containing protein n=1 Tax=Natronobacterium haloterrestre TaxID=148448 RepID=A0A1I1K2P1_NATHA|nr:histidine kinase [Halobiforma haloterrestris]SFC54771.1 hypothetical protein SAMN05444422_11052 [Halobiforma haloterrestris]